MTVRTLADVLHASFSRIQFTPDLLPADVVGTMIFEPQHQKFTVRHGPIFAQIVLADEVNRAPAKVQSALLEAMQERQVTIGGTTYQLPEPFLVLATQNPIESEGTYPLPEAQLDRFLLKVKVDYPLRAEEREVLLRMSGANETIPVRRLPNRRKCWPRAPRSRPFTSIRGSPTTSSIWCAPRANPPRSASARSSR